MKRIFSLLLVVLMLISVCVMTGCSDDEITADIEGTSVKAMTLTLYTIKDDNTSQEAIEAVQEAINDITESKFNTHIVIRAYNEADYYDVVDGKIDAIEAKRDYEEKLAAAIKTANKAAKSAGVTTIPVTEDTDTEAETDETILNEFELEEVVYPDVSDDQFDIFLINDYGKYVEYYEKEVILALDEELSVNCKILKDYIYPTYLNAVKLDGKTYGIPNNHIVGEYEYMIINKELFDGLYLDISTITSISSLSEYVSAIKDKEGIVPVVDTYGAEAANYDPTGEGLIVGGYTSGKLDEGERASIKSLLDIRGYRQTLALTKTWQLDGLTSSDESVLEAGNFGVAFVKGDYSLKEKYEESGDYYVVVNKYPTFTNEEVFSGVYAVGAYCKNISRCMEVISLFTINEDFINTMYYGVEDVNYEVDEYTGMVTILNDDYKMNMDYVGNQFKIWQNDRMTDSELNISNDSWAIAKLQNYDAQYSPFLTFYYDRTDPVEDEESEEEAEEGEIEEEETVHLPIAEVVAGVKALTEDIRARIDAFVPGTEYSYTVDNDGTEVVYTQVCNTYDEYLLFLSYEIKANIYVQELTSTKYDHSLVMQYETWYAAHYATSDDD